MNSEMQYQCKTCVVVGQTHKTMFTDWHKHVIMRTKFMML